jgi:hypothetical protein
MQERHGSQRWFWGATFDRSFGSSEAYSQRAEAGKLIWDTCCLAIDEGAVRTGKGALVFVVQIDPLELPKVQAKIWGIPIQTLRSALTHFSSQQLNAQFRGLYRLSALDLPVDNGQADSSECDRYRFGDWHTWASVT